MDISANCYLVLAHKAGDCSEPRNFRMLAMTSCLAKPFHEIKAKRMANYMVENEYIDKTLQKAYLEGINGCIEHIEVIQQVIQDAKARNRTVHISWFDLADAFGSVSHDLIPICLEHYKIPAQEIAYIVNLYSKLEGKVKSKSWETETFKFKKGIFQGDNYSPIIFLVVFNPLIDYIKLFKETHGYQLGNTRIITKPFADDFEILTNNKRKHQKLQNEIQQRCQTMGLMLKPSKCRSLSITSGKPTNNTFSLWDYTDNNNHQLIQLKTLEEEPLKFLGSRITFKNNASDHFQVLQELLEEKLSNLEKCSVRGEYKVKIYSRYIMPSLRFHFSVHNIHQTHLDKLDHLARRYLKTWLKFPSNGVSDISIFHPYMLGVKPPSQVYLEGHAGNYLNSRVRGDPVVQEALDVAVEREEAWIRKSSTICQCRDIFNEVEETCFIPTPTNTYNHNAASRLSLPKLKKQTNTIIAQKYLEKFSDQANNLAFQGEFLQLLQEEQQNATWKSFIYAVPRGVMSFAMRASTNSLATPDNLARWGKVVDPSCKLCSDPDKPNTKAVGTLGHILNNCPRMLDRYEWRHNGIVSHLYETFRNQKIDGLRIYADIEGAKVNGGTIPADIAITTQRPDIVIINTNTTPTSVLLVELTVPFTRNIEAANARKKMRYEYLAQDIEEKGYKCSNIPLEVGSRGHVTARNRETLTYLCHTFKVGKFSNVIRNCSKLALLGSYSIFIARSATEWSGSGYLKP